MQLSDSEFEALKARICELESQLAEVRSANEELQHFAYAACHDLKTPLRTVSSFAVLLAKRYQGKLDREADEFIDFILTAARRSEKLILDLLVYSRLIHEPMKPSEQVDMQAVVSWVMMNLDEIIKKSGARIECGALPAVTGDQQQLVQLLQHLFRNAILYRSDEAPQIRFTAEERDGEFLFGVADNGIGFEMKYAEQIFGAFKRLHSQDCEATGMGLAISKKIAERHGGRMWAESRPGIGSTFYFTLPA